MWFFFTLPGTREVFLIAANIQGAHYIFANFHTAGASVFVIVRHLSVIVVIYLVTAAVKKSSHVYFENQTYHSH